jgi:hypothetical protein
MKFGYTILYVDDVPATLAAWEQSFGLTREYLHEDGIRIGSISAPYKLSPLTSRRQSPLILV